MALGPKSRVSSSDYSDSGYAPSSGSAAKRRETSPFPSFPSLLSVLKHPRVFKSLLSWISYADFNVLTSSCSELRNLMQKPDFKDAILSCFLPGFRSLLRFKAPELFVDVRVTVGDLNIFREPNLFYFSFLILTSYDASRSLEYNWVARVSNPCPPIHHQVRRDPRTRSVVQVTTLRYCPFKICSTPPIFGSQLPSTPPTGTGGRFTPSVVPTDPSAWNRTASIPGALVLLRLSGNT